MQVTTWTQVQNRLSGNRFARDVSILAVSNIFNQLLLAIMTLILARLYTPNELGVWAVFINVALMFAPILNLRYELAILLPKEKSEAANIFILGSLITLLISGIVLVAALLWGYTL